MITATTVRARASAQIAPISTQNEGLLPGSVNSARPRRSVVRRTGELRRYRSRRRLRFAGLEVDDGKALGGAQALVFAEHGKEGQLGQLFLEREDGHGGVGYISFPAGARPRPARRASHRRAPLWSPSARHRRSTPA